MKYRSIVATTLVAVIFSAGLSVQTEYGNVAKAESAPALSIPLTVAERNGVEVNDYFFRRGVALPKGEVFSVNDISITENDEPITSSAEILQKYDDGSVNWMLVSGLVSIGADETKELVITNIAPSAPLTTVTEEDGVITVDGEKIDFTLGENGISSLKYNGEEQLTGDIKIYAEVNGNTGYSVFDDIKVLKNTPSYIKIKASGAINDVTSGEMYITLAEGASKLQIDYRITVKDEVTINNTGLIIPRTPQDYERGTVVSSDYIDLNGMQLATRDTTRFNGGTSEEGKTGFIINVNSVHFAPIVNDSAFKYYDGVSRTAHLHIGFGNNAENMAKTLATTPAVSVDPEQYVKAGEILTTKTGALIDSVIETFTEDWEKTLGSFYVGGIGTYNYKTKEGGISAAMPGEIEYNFGMAYMQTGNEEIYRKIYDMAELRSDVGIYRGMHKDAYGLMRARITKTNTTGTSFFQSHGYYSDESGLYMAYLLSGDEYFYESYKLCMEKTLRDMYLYKSVDNTNVPVSWFFGGNGEDPTVAPTRAGFFESRGLIRARSLYLASKLFENEEYKRAAEDVIEWAKLVQLDSGAYTQAINHDGSVLYHGGQTQMPVKDYVMLMGIRGISQLLDWESNDDVLDIVIKVADYLCSQGENFGNILLHPNGDIEVYEVNEDNSRAARTESNIMAIDVLCTAFEKTGNTRYLKWILTYLDSYVASSVGGLGGGMREQGYGTSFGWSADNVRVTSILKTSDNLNKLFRNYKQTIIEMGFEHLTNIFADDAKWLGEAENISVKYPMAISNLYETDGIKTVFAFNQYPKGADEDDNWAQKISLTFSDNMLWQGSANIVKTNEAVVLEKRLNKRAHIAAIQRPVYIEEISAKAEININKYTKDEIELLLKGDTEATIKFTNGLFEITDGTKYTLTVSAASGGTKVLLSKGGTESATNGEIKIKVNGNGEIVTENNNVPSGPIVVAPSGGGGGGAPTPKPEEETKEEPKEEEPKETEPEEEEPTVEIPTEPFGDISQGEWFYDSLLYMKKKGIMVGDNNEVRPHDAVTRGEFAKIIVTAFGLEKTEAETQFADTTDVWWGEYAEIAFANGIVYGVGESKFDGNGIITREMMAVMIDRALKACEITLQEKSGSDSFSDREMIASYAKEAVAELAKLGIVNGVGDGTFAPTANVKRCEAAQIIYNILKQTDEEKGEVIG